MHIDMRHQLRCSFGDALDHKSLMEESDWSTGGKQRE